MSRPPRTARNHVQWALLDEALERDGRPTDGSYDDQEGLINYAYLLELLERAHNTGWVEGRNAAHNE